MKWFWTAAILAGVAFLSIGGALWMRWRGRIAEQSPLREELAELRDIDPRLITHREAARWPSGLAEARGIAVGPGDRVYVAGDTAVVELGGDGGIISRISLAGLPRCVSAAPDGTIYVGMKDHVEVVDARGGPKAAWSRPDPATWITSLAASSNAVCAADFGRRIVMVYGPDGKLVRELRGFSVPSPYFDVALDPGGNLWVADTARHELVCFGADGGRLRSWGAKSARIEGFAGCCNPSQFAIRRDGAFVTAEKGLVRVKVHDREGKFVGVVAGPGDFSKGAVGLDVAVDSRGRVLILDPPASSVRVFIEKVAKAGD